MPLFTLMDYEVRGSSRLVPFRGVAALCAHFLGKLREDARRYVIRSEVERLPKPTSAGSILRRLTLGSTQGCSEIHDQLCESPDSGCHRESSSRSVGQSERACVLLHRVALWLVPGRGPSFPMHPTSSGLCEVPLLGEPQMLERTGPVECKIALRRGAFLPKALGYCAPHERSFSPDRAALTQGSQR